MAKQRYINTYFWSDDFILDLKADEKLFFLYVLTNPQTDLCGAYQIAMQKMVFETRLSEKRIRQILDKFEIAGKVCYRNGWMVVKNFTRHQSSKSSKIAIGIERSLSHCPDWVKDMLLKGMDRVSYPTAPEPEPEPELKPNGTTSKAKTARENSNRLDPHDAEKFGFAVEQFVTSFPDVRLSLIQAGLISSQVIDSPRSRQAWNETIAKYIANKDPAGKRYNPQWVGTVLEVYQDKLKKLDKENYAGNKPNTQTGEGSSQDTAKRIRADAEFI